jgi:hypothetical protein
MEFVIMSKRMRDWLFLLGLDFREVPDRSNRQEFIWLFKNNDKLKQAITFYKEFKSSGLDDHGSPNPRHKIV